MASYKAQKHRSSSSLMYCLNRFSLVWRYRNLRLRLQWQLQVATHPFASSWYRCCRVLRLFDEAWLLLLLLLHVSDVVDDVIPTPAPGTGLAWVACVSSINETALLTWSDIRSRLSVLLARLRRDARPHSIDTDLPRHPCVAWESSASLLSPSRLLRDL